MVRKRWIQDAIKRPGRVKRYLLRVYGRRAFTKSGEIKQLYLLKAIRRIKYGKGMNVKGLLQALYLAKKLERYSKR